MILVSAKTVELLPVRNDEFQNAFLPYFCNIMISLPSIVSSPVVSFYYGKNVPVKTVLETNGTDT